MTILLARSVGATGVCAAALMLAACSTTDDGGTANVLSAETSAAGTVVDGEAAPESTDALADAAATSVTPSQVASATSAGTASCPVNIAGGPPTKPDKGSDFAQNAVGKNVGRNVGRNLIANIGARAGGGLGGAITGGLARQAIRSEQDLDGNWTLTNGAPTCGCTIEISAGVSLQGAEATRGSLKKNDCTTLLANASRWTLGGRSFTGYNTTLTRIAKDNTPVAKLNRDGINYFSGQLQDGTSVTMWRRGG
ncbi:MAG: hypothetical protein AAFR27_09830 [Pseudomonadota bacterium]